MLKPAETLADDKELVTRVLKCDQRDYIEVRKSLKVKTILTVNTHMKVS